jgi:RNA recognition motif-containing protein
MVKLSNTMLQIRLELPCLCLESLIFSGLPFPQSPSKFPTSKKVDKMAKKIFVGNLSFQTTENDLNDLFAQFGGVESVSIITDRDTGRSKGFGFVAMNDDSAERAISQLNGTDLNGRALTVNEAHPMVKKDFGGRQNSGRSGRGGYGRY